MPRPRSFRAHQAQCAGLGSHGQPEERRPPPAGHRHELPQQRHGANAAEHCQAPRHEGHVHGPEPASKYVGQAPKAYSPPPPPLSFSWANACRSAGHAGDGNLLCDLRKQQATVNHLQRHRRPQEPHGRSGCWRSLRHRIMGFDMWVHLLPSWAAWRSDRGACCIDGPRPVASPRQRRVSS